MFTQRYRRNQYFWYKVSTAGVCIVEWIKMTEDFSLISVFIGKQYNVLSTYNIQT